MSTYQVIFLLACTCISAIVIRSSSGVRSADDFSVANRSLKFSGVSWIIIGTLVGGVSTVGTVQTAYTHGIAAGIFTFGSGLSCFLLGCFFARPLREEQVVTVSEYLGRYFGQRFRGYCSAINSFGMFIHVVGQFLAAMAIIESIFGFGSLFALSLTTILMAIFVVSGGVSGAGLIGKIKFYMLYSIMLISAGLALYQGGGLTGIIADLPSDLDMFGLSRYGHKTAMVDMASMLLGVLSTQIYLQAIFSAKDVREARNGAFLSAAIIPPIGVLGTIVGLYLRAHYPELGADPSQALPFFLQHMFPPVVGAFFSAGILLVVLGTGAGLVLGVTTNIYNDFMRKSRFLHGRIQAIHVLRSSTLLILLLAALLVVTGLDSTILRWSYMSMGLRGTAVFAGLFVVVFFKRLTSSRLLLAFLYALPALYIVLSLL